MPRLTLPRIAAMALALAVVGISLSSAAPAEAVQAPAIVGSIDQIAVAYDDNDDTPKLHLSGWAVNLADPVQNGLGGMSVELTAAPAAGGAATTFGRVDFSGFALPRPDIAKAYPGSGPNHGWDSGPKAFGRTGSWKICARVWNGMVGMPGVGGAQVACVGVKVPAQRVAFHPTIPNYVSYGQTVYASTPAAPPAGSSVSYQWSRDVDPIRPTPIPGATRSVYTPGVADIGFHISLTTVVRQPGVTQIEQRTAQAMVEFGTYQADRVAGSDRYGTSVAASQSAFPDSTAGAPVAYLVSGQNYPDALSAGPAAAKQGGTMLLTRPAALPTIVANELVRLHPATVVVVGGPAAVSEKVVAAARALPFAPHVVRIAGSNRYATSRAVVQYAFGTSVPNLFLATGRGFPDALAAGSAAAGQGVPVLLTDGSLNRADAATAAELRLLGTSHVSVVGGTAVVRPGVASSLGSSITVARLAGNDRFATAAAIAATMPPSSSVYLANAYGYPDALVVSVLAGRNHAPLLLSSGACIPQSALSFMVNHGVVHGTVVGGFTVMDYFTEHPQACSR
jgi:putative cell wall-binding protein